jgi:hypothetical protein
VYKTYDVLIDRIDYYLSHATSGKPSPPRETIAKKNTYLHRRNEMSRIIKAATSPKSQLPDFMLKTRDKIVSGLPRFPVAGNETKGIQTAGRGKRGDRHFFCTRSPYRATMN